MKVSTGNVIQNMNAIWVFPTNLEKVSGFSIRVIGCSTKVSLWEKFNCDWTFFTHKIYPFLSFETS